MPKERTVSEDFILGEELTKIEVIVRTTDAGGKIYENVVKEAKSVIVLVEQKDGDARTVIAGEPRSIHALCSRVENLIEDAIKEILSRLKHDL